MSKTITKAIRAERRAFAEKLHDEYNKLTLQQKLDRLPVGGAKKQRARLEAQLQKQQEKAQAKTEKQDKKEESK